MAGSVASVKYSFFIVSTEQNLTFKNEKRLQKLLKYSEQTDQVFMWLSYF